ncbi:uncharacterized protein LOC106070792 isoform X1 [Biomphalaria glabrata]|uniref:Uncharacterized protein LOC106070792 isoform X1 n=1 Tax=Biomphalaria glabrata TaxID=6526 RepID=A0A9W3AY21_BIOGL|nr:uncharacterized protein LOC106070792 isoform X1 [Biomphalaria glabrata]XP_055892109.1 uncharacterized protein LOC106070792 isoform X1 [Biomphalaria glabrata]
MANIFLRVLLLLFSLDILRVNSDVDLMSTLTYFWPFCNDSMAFEIKYQFDADKPKKGSCPLLDIGPPELPVNVFLFDDDPKNVATIRMKSYTGLWDDLGLVFRISPETNQGVILEYVAEKVKKDTVNSVTVELQNNCILVTIGYDDGTQDVGLSRTRIELWSWAVVAISRAKSSGQLVIQVGLSVQVINTTAPTTLPFNDDGKLYVSYTSDAKKTFFQGRFCCLAMFTSVIPIGTDPQTIISLFKENNWPGQAPGVKSSCPLGVDYRGPPVVKLWPLQTGPTSSFAYDVVEGSGPLAPPDFNCFRSRDVFDYTNTSVGYLDGSVFSYLTLPVSQPAIATDLTIAIFVRPDPPVEGLVLEFDSYSQKPDVISKMSMKLDSGLVVVDLYNNGALCLSLTNSQAVPANNWSLVQLVYTTAINTVALYVNESGNSNVLNCSRGSALTLNGTITLGQGQNSSVYDAGYHGSAACLTIFQGVLDAPSAMSKTRERCITLNKVVVPAAPCNKTTSLKRGKFKMVAENLKPDVGLKLSVEDMPTRSLVDCSSRCRQVNYCRSVTYKKLNASSQCSLYDYVTKQGLMSDTGSRYYVITET